MLLSQEDLLPEDPPVAVVTIANAQAHAVMNRDVDRIPATTVVGLTSESVLLCQIY
jgi:hypothetical protein